MSVFVSKSGTWSFTAGDSPTRADTPILEVRNLIPENLVRVSVNMMARTAGDGSPGFYYQIAAVNAEEVQVLSPATGILQSSPGWQSATRTAYFVVKQTTQSPAEDVDFEVNFTKGDLSGQGELNSFLLEASVVSLRS